MQRQFSPPVEPAPALLRPDSVIFLIYREEVFVDKETDKVFVYWVSKYVMEKKEE